MTIAILGKHVVIAMHKKMMSTQIRYCQLHVIIAIEYIAVQASILATINAKDLGPKMWLLKLKTRHIYVLAKLGADVVVQPTRNGQKESL